MMIKNKNHKKIQQIDFVIPGEDYENDGKMKWMVLNDNFFVGYIDIYSRFLPKSVFAAFSTIAMSDNRIKRCMEDIREDILNFTDEELLETDVIKSLLLLKGVSFDADIRRTFCTGSQVDIAKKAFEMVNGDLSKRYSASELASAFGVSESSLKNYIRVVFGRGYKELVNETRMKKAADLIINSEKNMGEIAESVGYQNQSRFSEAFLKYHKVLLIL